jgi:hypothetical protein
MNSIRTLRGALALSVSFLASLSTTAMAEERVCTGTLGAVTVDNLLVPPNATCTLYGTRVKGTVKVESNAKLSARKVMVIGNVQAENARLVLVMEKFAHRRLGPGRQGRWRDGIRQLRQREHSL